MPLNASYLTLSGAPFGYPPVNNVIVRSDAAYSAGYTSIGATADEMRDSDLSYFNDALSVPIRELEWYDLGNPDKETERTLFAMAEVFGATQVNTGVTSRHDVPVSVIADRLSRFARKAAKHSLTVAVESVAFGTYYDPMRVMSVISLANEPNVGFLYDTWQVARASEMTGKRANIPGECIVAVQLSGYVPTSDDAFTAAQYERDLPNDRTRATLRRIADSGFNGPYSVEIASAVQYLQNPFTAARDTFKASEAVLP